MIEFEILNDELQSHRCSPQKERRPRVQTEEFSETPLENYSPTKHYLQNGKYTSLLADETLRISHH